MRDKPSSPSDKVRLQERKQLGFQTKMDQSTENRTWWMTIQNPVKRKRIDQQFHESTISISGAIHGENFLETEDAMLPHVRDRLNHVPRVEAVAGNEQFIADESIFRAAWKRWSKGYIGPRVPSSSSFSCIRHFKRPLLFIASVEMRRPKLRKQSSEWNRGKRVGPILRI